MTDRRVRSAAEEDGEKEEIQQLREGSSKPLAAFRKTFPLEALGHTQSSCLSWLSLGPQERRPGAHRKNRQEEMEGDGKPVSSLF